MNTQLEQQLRIYEQPLNERMRIFLRFEHLFNQMQCYQTMGHWLAMRQAVHCLVEILALLERIDIKGEIIKELERCSSNLARLKETPHVDHEKLNEVLYRSQHLVEQLHGLDGKIGTALKENELFVAIKQRDSMPGGPCSFDLPAYFHWLNQPAEHVQQLFSRWASEFDVINLPIQLVLGIIRESAVCKSLVAERGFYEQNLNTNVPYQFIRVLLPDNVNCFPEISAGRHHLHIRFSSLHSNGATEKLEENVSFDLACCQI